MLPKDSESAVHIVVCHTIYRSASSVRDHADHVHFSLESHITYTVMHILYTIYIDRCLEPSCTVSSKLRRALLHISEFAGPEGAVVAVDINEHLGPDFGIEVVQDSVGRSVLEVGG